MTDYSFQHASAQIALWSFFVIMAIVLKEMLLVLSASIERYQELKMETQGSIH